MSDLRKAAQQALDVLDKCAAVCPASMEHKALRAALAQPERQTLTEDELAFVLSDVSWTGMQGFARAIKQGEGAWDWGHTII